MNPLYLNLHILIKCIKLSTRFNVFTATPGVNRRVGKFINFFSVVRFSNEGCTGAGGLNGTCYTKDECRDRNGAATSSCAGQTPALAPTPTIIVVISGGFGVCCIFGLSCGGTSSENSTYLTTDIKSEQESDG